MKVLKNKRQIDDSRKQLIKKGVSSIETPFESILRRLRIKKGVLVGDDLKSWDVLETLNFLEDNVSKDEAILDIGSYASEIIVALNKDGYKNLTGADLNPELNLMPGQGHIKYEVTDFMNTPFLDASFKAITSISVIEHGFNGGALLKEMSRLLTPEGYFIASFDYWPDKIDTTGIKFFDMDWLLFSKQDVEAFISLAHDFGLKPVGALDFESEDAPIDCAGKQYTFAFLVLQKEN